jgi:hypothetical protein
LRAQGSARILIEGTQQGGNHAICNDDRKKRFGTRRRRVHFSPGALPDDRGAAAKYVARMSIEVQEGTRSKSPWNASRSSLARKPSGEVEIKVFPNSQLGGELETAEEFASVQSRWGP